MLQQLMKEILLKIKFISLIFFYSFSLGIFLYFRIPLISQIPDLIHHPIYGWTLFLKYFLLSFSVYLLFWILFSVLLSKTKNIGLSKAMNIDIFTYLPSCIFIFYGFQWFTSIDPKFIWLLERLLIISVSSLIFSIKYLMGEFDIVVQRYTPNVKIILFILITTYTVIFSILSILRNLTFHTDYDLGFYDQALWNLKQGIFISTIPAGKSLNIFVSHSDYLLLAFVPIYTIYTNSNVLLFLQSLIIALGVLPIFWISKKKLNSDFAGILFSGSYLLTPTIQWFNLFDFHIYSLSTTILLFTFYYLESKKYKLYLLFFILSLLIREEISLILFMFGIYFITININSISDLPKKENLKWLIPSFVIAPFWFYMAISVIIPSLWGGNYIYLESYYSYLGNNLYDIISILLNNPSIIIKNIFTFEKMTYITLLFLPLFGFSLLGLRILIIALPIFLINILAINHDIQYSIRGHYSGPIIAFLFLSAIYGISKFILYIRCSKSTKSINLDEKRLMHGVVFFVFFASLISNIFFSPSPISISFEKENYIFTDQKHKEILDRTIKLIPENASVSAHNGLVPHLSHRNEIYMFPSNYDKTDYVITDSSGKTGTVPRWPFPTQEEYNGQVQKLLKNKNYTIIMQEDNVIVFKKIIQ